jgi:hypothetical protein
MFIEIACVVAGAAILGWGIYAGREPRKATKEVADQVGPALDTAKKAIDRQQDSKPGEGEGMGDLAKQQADISVATDYVNALAELAKGLEKLSPTLSAFLVSSIFFFLAVAMELTSELAS